MIAVRPTTDEALINRIVGPLYSEICEESLEGLPFVIKSSDTWLKFMDNNQVIGLMRLEPFVARCIRIHPVIPKNKRRGNLPGIIYSFHEWAVEHIKEDKAPITTLNALIPGCHQHIKYFAAIAGWHKMGMIPDCYRKFGQLHDLVLVGVSMRELRKRYAN